jgi:aspartate carbamoyltransferase catalytic subunit
MAIFADNSQGSLLCAQFTLVHGHLLMTVSALDFSMGDKTQKEKHKKDLQHEAKREAAEHEKQETREAQHHPISGHPATAEHPASSGTSK